ncbi:hypothetical protein ACHWQZ_G008835 [Mnemiopsis leidyi]
MSDLFGGLILISAGTLYPAYSSYKAVKTKNTREYVKWMMYWIVFAFFNAITLFTDVFISWFPGYYLFKTLFIIWLVSPATRGSTYLYKKVLHPTLRQNEEKIDRTIANIKERGYDYSSQYARMAMQNFSRTLMEAVFRGQVMIADQMQRQYMQNNSGPIVQTDGRETERLNRSSAPPPNAQFPQDDGYGRLYRVDSQMFEMDDEFVELSADMDGDRPDHSAARQRRRAHKSRGSRPMSMPPPTIEEMQHPLDEGTYSDPDYLPDPEETSKKSKSSRRHSIAVPTQKGVRTKLSKREASEQANRQTDTQTNVVQTYTNSDGKTVRVVKRKVAKKQTAKQLQRPDFK